jgi:hypothetical protein
MGLGLALYSERLFARNAAQQARFTWRWFGTNLEGAAGRADIAQSGRQVIAVGRPPAALARARIFMV